jgi:hypothetical protein
MCKQFFTLGFLGIFLTVQVQSAVSASGDPLTQRLRQIGALELRQSLSNTGDISNLAQKTAGISVTDFGYYYWDGTNIYNKARDLVDASSQLRPTLPLSQSMPALPQPTPELPVPSSVTAELRRLGEELMVCRSSVIDESSGAFRNNELISSAGELKVFAAGYQDNNGNLDQMIWFNRKMMSRTSYESQWTGPTKIRMPYSPPIKLSDALRGIQIVAVSPTPGVSTGIPSPSPAPQPLIDLSHRSPDLAPIPLPRPTQSSTQPTPSPIPLPRPVPSTPSVEIPAPQIASPTVISFAPIQERQDIVAYRTHKSQLQDICDSGDCGPNVRAIANAVQQRVAGAQGMDNLTESIVAETAYAFGSAIDTSKRVWQVTPTGLDMNNLFDRSVTKVENALDLLNSSQDSFGDIMSALFQPPANGLPDNKLADLVESEVGFGAVNTARLANVRRVLRNRM